MNAHQLGPRASILLGLLDSPMTADEIAYRIEQAVEDDQIEVLLVEARHALLVDPNAALRSLADEGTFGIARQLARLRDAGLVASVEVGHQALYHRLPLP